MTPSSGCGSADAGDGSVHDRSGKYSRLTTFLFRQEGGAVYYEKFRIRMVNFEADGTFGLEKIFSIGNRQGREKKVPLATSERKGDLSTSLENF